MPDAKNPDNLGRLINFVEQDIGMGDDPFAGAVAPVSAHVGKHGEVFGCFFEAEENPLGGVRIARK